MCILVVFCFVFESSDYIGYDTFLVFVFHVKMYKLTVNIAYIHTFLFFFIFFLNHYMIKIIYVCLLSEGEEDVAVNAT